MSNISTNVTQGGRIVIPAHIRQKMQLHTGDQVLLDWSEERGELRVVSRKQRLQQARELVSRYAEPGVSVVDELIAERRASAANE